VRPVALLAAFVASAARAQDADPITLYGRVYVLVESVSADGDADPLGRRQRVSNQASMVGVRGVERFTPDLAAWFQIETGFPPDAAATAFANRNSGVGLTGSFGTLFAGRWDSTFEQSQVGIVDPFTDQGLPDITGAAVNQGNFARRQQNVVQYWSPVWRGVQAKLGYAANEGRTSAVNPYDYGASLAYRDDRAYLAIAYERHVDQAGAVAAAGIDEAGSGISGYRRFECVKLSAQAGAYRRTGTATQRSHMIGFEWNPLGAGCPRTGAIAIYQRSSGGGASGLAQPACTLWGVGARHALSGRTFLIAEYARVSNREGNLCNFGSNPVDIGARQSLTGWGAGIRTVF
jgi:predicted porin